MWHKMCYHKGAITGDQFRPGPIFSWQQVEASMLFSALISAVLSALTGSSYKTVIIMINTSKNIIRSNHL